MSTNVKSTELIQDQLQHKDEKIPDDEKQIAEGGSTGGSEGSNCEGEIIKNENQSSSNPPELGQTEQKANNQIDMIGKLLGVENLKNSMIQDSPQNASSNNSSIVAEQTPNNQLLNEYLEGIKHIREEKNERKHNTDSKLCQGAVGNVNNSQQEMQNNNGQTQSDKAYQRKKSTDVNDSVLNQLIKQACEQEELSEDSNLFTKDENIREGLNVQNADVSGQYQQQNGKNIGQDPHMNSGLGNSQLEIQFFKQSLSNSPIIKLNFTDHQNDSTTQSLCLDTKESITQDHQTQDAIPISSCINNNNLLSASQQLNDSPSPNVSLFAQMSKQQSKRDMKNWAQGKSFIGGQRGSGNLVSSTSGVNAASNSMSQFILQKKVSLSSHQGGLADSRDMNSLDDSLSNSAMIEQLSESVPVCAQPKKKTISLLANNKKSIKITNTTSTELKQYNFQDDDIINVDQKAYQNLAQSYNINQNINISIKTLLNYQISSTTQKNTLNVAQAATTSIASSPSKQSSQNLNVALGDEKKSLNSQQSESFKTNNNNSSNSLDNISHTSSSSHKGGNADNKSVSNDKEDQIELEKSGLLDTPPKFEQVTTKKVVIPVLLSVKTEEQMLSFQYIEQLEQNQSEKDIHSLHQIDKNSPLKIVEENKRLSIDMIHIEQGSADEVKEQSENQGDKGESSSCKSEGDQPFNSDDIISQQDDQFNNKQEESKVTHSDQEYIPQDDSPETPEPEVSRKISQKNILMKSIKTKAKNTKDKLLKQIQEDTKKENEMILSNPGKTHSSAFFQGLGNQFQSQPMRFPIDLICVIDTSGSMNGEPLELLKETLLFLVDLLQSGDRICLIQFSTNAKRLTPLLAIEQKDNTETIKGEINRLVAKGGTNISQGMQLAFDVLKQRRFKNPITSVFLLSDGLNDGAENKIRDLLKQLNFYQNYNEENFTIQTFGFGKDHDPNLMDKISQLMDGNFYYIGDIHRIDECFIDALGGLFSVISQNVAIRIQVPHDMRNKIKIVKTYGEIWHVVEPYYEYVININQLLCGVSKDYILEIEIDSKIIDDSQCIQEIHSEEEILSSDCIGSNRNFDNKNQILQNNNSSPNILQAQLKAKNISINANHLSSSKQQSQTEYQPSAPDLQIKEGTINSKQLPKLRGSIMSAVLPGTSGTELNNFSPLKNQTQTLKHLRQPNEVQSSLSQSETSQLSINVIPVLSEDPFISVTNTKSQNQENKSIQEFSNDYVIKKDFLNLKNHKQIQESLVKLHYLRVKGAEGLEKCQAFALQKKFDEGNEYVNRILSELNEQPEDTRRNLSKLILDLTEAQDTLRKKIGEQIGWHRMISCKRMHMEQRSAGTDLTYQNSVQKIMVQRRKSIKDQNSIQSLTETITKMQNQIGFGLSKNSSQDRSDNKNQTSSDSSSDSSSNSSSSQESTPKNKQNLLRKKKSYTLNPSLYREDSKQKDEIKGDEETNNQSPTQKSDENNKTEEIVS